MPTDEFQSPGRHGGQQSHNGLDLSAVEGGLTADPGEGGGQKLVSRSWETARLSAAVDVAGVGPRNVDAHLFVNGKRVWPTEITAEGDGRLIIEGDLDPRSVPVGTHSVRVTVSDGRGESASVGVGEVQIFGAGASESADSTVTAAASPTPTRTTTATATTGSTDSTILGLPRDQAVVAGAGVSVLALVFGGLLL